MPSPDTRPLDLAAALEALSARGMQHVESQHVELLRDASAAIRLLYTLFIEAACDNLRLRGAEVDTELFHVKH